mmetsp:Transcript_61110/g.137702  ORF Transcript_61110/g.137702 Transcript_61110/m.137702 type:complete len:264 (-) Transcript_61110:652-1443(-)
MEGTLFNPSEDVVLAPAGPEAVHRYDGADSPQRILHLHGVPLVKVDATHAVQRPHRRRRLVLSLHRRSANEALPLEQAVAVPVPAALELHGVGSAGVQPQHQTWGRLVAQRVGFEAKVGASRDHALAQRRDVPKVSLLDPKGAARPPDAVELFKQRLAIASPPQLTQHAHLQLPGPQQGENLVDGLLAAVLNPKIDECKSFVCFNRRGKLHGTDIVQLVERQHRQLGVVLAKAPEDLVLMLPKSPHSLIVDLLPLVEQRHEWR